MMLYAQHDPATETFATRLFTKAKENRYPYVETAENREGYTCHTSGFQWLERGVSATGIYVYDPITEEYENERIPDNG